MAPKNILPRKKITDFIDNLYNGDLHAKRVLSLANATLGVLVSASLAVHAIGQGLAQALGKLSKHGVKQVDRLLSNQGIDVWEFFGYWVPYLVGARLEVVVAMDWTSFARDQQDTVVLSMLTGHGRATPLMWRTVRSSTLKGQMKRYEKELLERLREVVPSQVKVTVVADRGFGDCKLFKTIAQELGFAYVIRIRGDIYVTSAKGERHKAAQWVGQGGRSRTLRGAQVTDEHHLEVGRVVCVHDRKMKEPWCLVASESTVGTRTLIRYYGKRWGDRDELSRHQGHAVRDGAVGEAGFEPAATGPDVIAQCVGDCIAVVVGRGGGELGLRPMVEGEHGEISHTLVVSSGVDVV